MWIGLIYFFVNILYSLFLKKIVLVDIFTIASGFVLRVMAGGIILDIHTSSWTLITTLFLALFLGFCKRRSELELVSVNPARTKTMLGLYNRSSLEAFILITSTMTIVSYAFFTTSSHALEKFGTDSLVYSIPFVAYGIFRYYLLINMRYQGKTPTEILFLDWPTWANILLWAAIVIVILKFNL